MLKMINYFGKFVSVQKMLVILVSLFGLFISTTSLAEAASLALSPETGVYQANGTFSVRVMVNTGGQAINAADGSLSFNPRELSVVSVNRTSSIFNLWVAEPSFSNSAGTVSFSGGSPSGYTGQSGNIMTITFRAAGAGTARVSFKDGSVLANDGKGTNILTAMNSGTFTIQAANTTPVPEVIEYVAPANTPQAPSITSSTHGDPSKWFAVNEAKLRWSIPSGVTAIRTLLDSNPTSVPTKVYDTPISDISLSELPEGASYFHLQFKNREGWGKIAHYRLAVDTAKPESINITQADNNDFTSPVQTLYVEVVDLTSLVDRFMIKLDEAEPFEYLGSTTIPLPSLEPGYHSIIIEAFDQAGNSIIGTYSFTIISFDKPIFTDFPNQINEEVIPVIKGLTKPNSVVEIKLNKIGSEGINYNVNSNEKGEFIFIPEAKFSSGVYELSAVATDQYGAKSESSDTIRIAVQQPGFVRIGSLLVSVLSVIIPLIVLSASLVMGLWYLVFYARRFQRKVRVESIEALQILRQEFSALQTTLHEQESTMLNSRKIKKLTKGESEMIEIMDRALHSSQMKVEKEILDITDLVRKKVK